MDHFCRKTLSNQSFYHSGSNEWNQLTSVDYLLKSRTLTFLKISVSRSKNGVKEIFPCADPADGHVT